VTWVHAIPSPAGVGNKTIRYIADAASIDPNLGFVPDIDGDFSFKSRHDTTLRVMKVLAGHFYRLDLAEFDLDASVASQAVTVFFRVSA